MHTFCMAYFYNILILFAIRKYFHKHVRHIMKNITVKYTGIVQKYSYGHILSVKKSIYNVLYRKKTENYRINEKNIQSKTTYFA